MKDLLSYLEIILWLASIDNQIVHVFSSFSVLELYTMYTLVTVILLKILWHLYHITKGEIMSCSPLKKLFRIMVFL